MGNSTWKANNDTHDKGACVFLGKYGPADVVTQINAFLFRD